MSFDPTVHGEQVTELVRSASDRALAWYRQVDRSQIDNKQSAGFDPVTEADRSVEVELRRAIGELFPDHAVLGEEFGLRGHSPYRWTIDPIDGTRAFICGQPMWGTLLGLQHDGEPVAGWLHVPVLGETYYHVGDVTEMRLSDGSRRPLVTSATTDLGDAIVTSTHPDMFAPGDEADRFNHLVGRTRMSRFSGDCVNYALLAMGLIDLVVENKLAIYDIVPLIPIVTGAGGVITNLDGEIPLAGGYVVAAATPALHAAALELLRPS